MSEGTLNAERQWLTAVMAVQLGLADPRKVMAALSRWSVEREGDLSGALQAEGALDEERRRMLDALVEQAMEAAGGEAARAMEDLGGAADISRSLGLSPWDAASAGVPMTAEQPGRYRIEPDEREGDTVRDGPDWRVLRAYDAHLGRAIVIKEFTGDLQGRAPQEQGEARRFIREARITGQLEHPNIVSVYELGQRGDGRPYYTMKSIRGRSFGAALADCAVLRERLGLLRQFLGLCQAVAYSHEHGVVLRALDPHHVLLGKFGETVVLEWSQALVRPGAIDLIEDLSAGEREATAELLEPSTYMSPEQAAGHVEAVDERSDVWTLGAILFELLSGRTLFARSALVAPIPDGRLRKDCAGAPAELVSICRKALRASPRERYRSAKELARDVEAYLTGRRVTAHAYGLREFLGRFARRQGRALRLSLFGVLSIVLATAGSAWHAIGDRDRAFESQRDEARLWADSLLEGARLDVWRFDFTRARAKLRAVVELEDRRRARELWAALGPELASRSRDVFALERCQLLREIWSSVPFVWDAGRLRRASPPAGHVCLIAGRESP